MNTFYKKWKFLFGTRIEAMLQGSIEASCKKHRNGKINAGKKGR